MCVIFSSEYCFAVSISPTEIVLVVSILKTFIVYCLFIYYNVGLHQKVYYKKDEVGNCSNTCSHQVCCNNFDLAPNASLKKKQVSLMHFLFFQIAEKSSKIAHAKTSV